MELGIRSAYASKSLRASGVISTISSIQEVWLKRSRGTALTNAGATPLPGLLAEHSDKAAKPFNVTGFVLRSPAEIWKNSWYVTRRQLLCFSCFCTCSSTRIWMAEEINSDSKEFPRKLSNKCSTGTLLFKYFVPTAKDANEVVDRVLIYASKVKYPQYLVRHHVSFPTDKGIEK